MKSNEANIIVLIASIIVGILISMNINFGKTNDRMFLNTEQYTEAYNYKIRLDDEVDKLMDEFILLNIKINKYENNDESEAQVLEDIKEEINENKMIIGSMDVEGPGIRILLNDISTSEFGVVYDRRQLIHDFDMIYVLNDLKNAGAEAISVNGQRIIDRSGVICNKQFLDINEVQEPAPYYIEAIGDKDKLKSYMLKDENYLKYLSSDYRGIFVEVEEHDSLKIPAYNGSMQHNYEIIKK